MRKREEEERHRQEERMRELEELKKLRQHYVEKTKEILRLPQVVYFSWFSGRFYFVVKLDQS